MMRSREASAQQLHAGDHPMVCKALVQRELCRDTGCHESIVLSLHWWNTLLVKYTQPTWQSHVEIEGHSVAYFDHIAVFEVSYRWVKGGAHTCFIDARISNASTKCVWALPLMEVQRYGASKAADAIEIYDGITFDFYMGLPHIWVIILVLTHHTLDHLSGRLPVLRQLEMAYELHAVLCNLEP